MVDGHELADRGTLFTFTTQGFLPKEPYTGPETEDDFAGYALGYVELPGEVIVETRLTESDPAEAARSAWRCELVVVPFRTDPDGTEVMTTRSRPVRERGERAMNVAIVGVGIHPFGRFEGVTGLDLGAYAVRQAVARRGHRRGPTCSSRSAAASPACCPGSDESSPGRPAREPARAHGHPVHERAQRVRDRRAARSRWARRSSSRVQYDLGVCVGFDRHPRGHFNATPEQCGLPHWYGDLGFMITTQFFAMKINRYMHDYGISHDTLAKVAAKNFRNGALNPNAWRRKPFSEEEILESRMLNYPLTQYMFCSPDEGAAAVVLCRAERAHRVHRSSGVPARRSRCAPASWARSRCSRRGSSVDRGHSPTVDAAAACFEQAGVAPSDVDVAQLQDSESGAEIMHMSETGLCADGEQEAMIQAGETEIGGRLPVNTDGGLIANGEPIGASGMRQVYEIVLQLRGDAGERQVPGCTDGRLHPGLRRARRERCTLLTV